MPYEYYRLVGEDIQDISYKDIKTYLIHNYDVYNVIERDLSYTDEIIVE